MGIDRQRPSSDSAVRCARSGRGLKTRPCEARGRERMSSDRRELGRDPNAVLRQHSSTLHEACDGPSRSLGVAKSSIGRVRRAGSRRVGRHRDASSSTVLGPGGCESELVSATHATLADIGGRADRGRSRIAPSPRRCLTDKPLPLALAVRQDVLAARSPALHRPRAAERDCACSPEAADGR